MKAELQILFFNLMTIFIIFSIMYKITEGYNTRIHCSILKKLIHLINSVYMRILHKEEKRFLCERSI